MTWEIISAHPDQPWDYDYLSGNPIITPLIVKNNPDKNWNWDTFSKNPNITPSMVRNNPRLPWNWYYLSRNEMNHHPYFCSDQYCKKQLKKFWEASKEEFIAVTWHPDRVLAGWCLDEDERLAFYGI